MRAAVVCANVLGWPLIQLSVSIIAFRLPRRWFAQTELSGATLRRMNSEIAFHRRWLRIRSWKNLLPDGGAAMGEFAKGKIEQRDAAYLATYATEARRGELAHWVMLAFTPVFFLWNPPWACVVMTIYGVVANLPCIVAQRYNRAFIMARLLCATRNSDRSWGDLRANAADAN